MRSVHFCKAHSPSDHGDNREYGEAVLKLLENLTDSDPKLQKAPVNQEGVRVSGFGGWFRLRLSLHDPVLPLNMLIDPKDDETTSEKYDPKFVWGQNGVYIEQGSVLEGIGLPLAVVKGIAGQTRLKVTVRGSQGHAGMAPMSMCPDPMAAAAELFVLLKSLCKRPKGFLSYDDQCNGFAV